MPPFHRGVGYRVIESHGFDADWKTGLLEGWINPMVDPVTLMAIKETLAHSPRAPVAIPGWPDNVRAIDFPRSATHPMGRLRISYEIVEDDSEVHLLSVQNINQQRGCFGCLGGSVALMKPPPGNTVLAAHPQWTTSQSLGGSTAEYRPS